MYSNLLNFILHLICHYLLPRISTLEAGIMLQFMHALCIRVRLKRQQRSVIIKDHINKSKNSVFIFLLC